MAKRGFGYFDRQGHYFQSAEDATQSDIAALLGRIDEDESIERSIAHVLFERRAEIEQIFAEHDQMVAAETGEGRAGADAGESLERRNPLRSKPRPFGNRADDKAASAESAKMQTVERPEETERDQKEEPLELSTMQRLADNATLAQYEDQHDEDGEDHDVDLSWSNGSGPSLTNITRRLNKRPARPNS